MKTKFISELNDTEKTLFKNSELYSKIKSHWLYTNSSIEYYKAYFINHIYDNSLVVFSGESFFLCTLSISEYDDRLSFFNNPITFFTSDELTSNYELKDSVYVNLYAFLKSKFPNLKNIENYSDSRITAYYFETISKSQTQLWAVCNLNNLEQTLKKDIRKSYKSLVNWGERNLHIDVIDCHNADKKTFDTFKNLHIEVAGRKTRNDETWDCQYKAIEQDEAFAIMGYLDGKLVAANLVMMGAKNSFHERNSYYGIGAYNRELMSQNIPLSHYIVFRSMLEAKKRECNIFELGDIALVENNDKHNNICKFKRGFTNIIEHRNISCLNFEIDR